MSDKISIELDGNEVDLIPSTEATIVLSAKYDGLAPLLQSLQRLNLQAAIDTVTAGLGLEGKAAKEVAGQVAGAGVMNLMPALINYVIILSNGRKPVNDNSPGAGG